MSEILQMPSREKYWGELTAEEKIERMACAIERLQHSLNDMAKVIQKLENHVHVEGRMFFADGPVSPLVWPNPNPLFRGPDESRLS